MDIKINSEFAHELVLAVPYAYWLHVNGRLSSVTTSTGMSPFYYFCNDVRESFTSRTLDNSQAGLNALPNTWIHHNAVSVTGKDYNALSPTEQSKVNGVLDYSQWLAPDYKNMYGNVKLFETPYIVVNNNFNIESGNDISKTMRYFDIKALYDIFNILTKKGYTVIYKRPTNTEFALDENEMLSVRQNITLKANVEGIGELTDYELCEYYDGRVINLNKIDRPEYSYNELQLRIFANASGFITPNGGGGILCGYFSAPVVMHVTSGKELRPNYLTNKDSYYSKLSDNTLHAVIDPDNKTNYSKLLEKIKEIYEN